MAPTGAGQSDSRDHDDDAAEALPAPPQQKTGMLLAMGIGGLLLIAVIGYAAARYMGLLQ